jgi:sigma-B regulation protein RsbU (phosphoserine phosphatase)
VSDVPGGLNRLERALDALREVGGGRQTLRLWRAERGGTVRLIAGAAPPNGWTPSLGGDGGGKSNGRIDTPEGAAWLVPVPESPDVWLEVRGKKENGSTAPGRTALAELVGTVLAAERETAQVAAELSDRYEEIDLVYTISEILGHTIQLEAAAQRILREVSTVVRARRATLLVADEERQVLRLIAAQGMSASEIEPIEMDDPCSVAARVFREQRTVAFDPNVSGAAKPPECPEDRRYRGKAFLSVPVMYAAPGAAPRAIGVINLTDRLGEDAFTAGDRKLVAAIANQIGAAIENARLVARDVAQQSVRKELELAHDLQLKLLPSPLVIAARADIAARCRSAESVGGDLYNFINLREGRVGAMIGDVSSHGFSAALIMALVIAASGIHAEAAEAPTEVLRLLEESLADELSRTEMFLTLFYAVIDPGARRITYASAGHQHAWVVPAEGPPQRLLATRPPLGLGRAAGSDTTRDWQPKKDIMCLFTDGIAEAMSARGDRFGEERVLGHVTRLRERPMREILEAIFASLAAFTDGAPGAEAGSEGGEKDDRTLVLLRT